MQAGCFSLAQQRHDDLAYRVNHRLQAISLAATWWTCCRCPSVMDTAAFPLAVGFFPAVEEAVRFLHVCAQHGFLGGLTKTRCCF